MRQTQTKIIYFSAWMIRALCNHLGWLPLVCILFSLVFSLYCLSAALNLNQENASIQPTLLPHPVAESSVDASNVTPALPAKEINASEMVDNFFSQIPVRADLELWMANIARLAQKQGVSMNTGNYQWKTKETQGFPVSLSQYDMHFALHGNYLKCRNFVASVLKQYPFIALSEMDIQRTEVSGSEVDVKVTFTVFIKRAGT